MVNTNVGALEWLREHFDGDGDDLLREIVREVAQRLMATEGDALVGARWGECPRTPAQPPQRAPAAPGWLGREHRRR